MSGEVLLEVRGLRTHFFTPQGVVRAVDGIDLKVRRGETLALVGESGSGKSVTSLSLLRLIDDPGRIVAGEIRLAGRDLMSLSEEGMNTVRGAKMAMIFQEPMTALDPIQQVGDQIGEALRVHRGLSRRAALAEAVALMAKLGIADPERRAHGYPHALSGGMRQRVMIAAALACGPDLVIADEPTTALDVTIQAQILDLLGAIKCETGAGVLLITHDLGVVAEAADRVAVMYAGQIVEEGLVGEIFRAPAHPYTQGLIACVPDIDRAQRGRGGLTSIAGVVPSPFDLPAGCRFRDRCPEAFERCGEEPRLEPVTCDHAARCWLNVA
jgi:oligopeptide/dipeptide ABC transporter ATP-binding protein